jgi:predicted O-methyltransferase YrrM
MPSRLRSFLTLGLSDLLTSLSARMSSVDGGVKQLAAENSGTHERLQNQIEGLQREVASLRSLITAQDDRNQRKLRAGLSSAVNLLSVLPHLKLEGVLPPFPHQGFEVTGELAAYLFRQVRRHRPKLIFELGSGSSTVLLAASARATGVGRVVSIEHDHDHLARTEQFLKQTDLSEYVELVAVPLREQDFGSLRLHWYDLAPYLRGLNEKIDLLFVDGPPGKLQTFSRYPALPVLIPHLAPNALILVDDGLREDETTIVEMWRELDVSFEAERLGFLPRSPYLIEMTGAEARVAELHRLRRDQDDASEEEPRLAGAERRTAS